MLVVRAGTESLPINLDLPCQAKPLTGWHGSHPGSLGPAHPGPGDDLHHRGMPQPLRIAPA